MAKNLRKIGTVGALAVLAGATMIAPAAHADDDIYRSGSYTVRAGTHLNGDLTVTNGTVKIYGTVDGDIRQIGRGSVIVHPSARVDGDILERSKGYVRVHKGASVDGDIVETGKGKLVVAGSVDGDLREYGAGSLAVRSSAHIDGDVRERGRGKLVVAKGATVLGDDDRWDDDDDDDRRDD